MESKTSARRMNKAERRRISWELRKQGHSIVEIARLVGVDHSTTTLDIQAAHKVYREQCDAECADLSRLYLARLDMLLTKLVVGINSGDPKSIATAIRLVERQCKIVGADAPPPKQSVEITSSPEDMSAEAIKQKLLAALEGTGNGP